MIEELSEKLAHQKASMIDAALARFLTEQGFETSEWNVHAMKKQLNDSGLQVLTKISGLHSELEVYTFELVKVLAKSSISIPQPHITFNNNPTLSDSNLG